MSRITRNSACKMDQTSHRPSGAVMKKREESMQRDVSNTKDGGDNSVNNLSLTYLESSMFATVLEDSLTEMRVLAECNNELRVMKTMTDMALLLTYKFNVTKPTVKDEFDGMDTQNLGCDKNKLNKLEADRKYFDEVLTSTYNDLTVNSIFTSLTKANEFIINQEQYRIYVINEENKNRLSQRDLHKQLRQQRNHIKTILYDADTTIEVLKVGVEDSGLNAEVRSRYIDNWQVARTEQNNLLISDTECLPSTNIEYYKQRFDQEQRIHSEVELLINITIQETLEKVEEWMNKYDKDMEAIDLKIQLKKNEYQDMFDKRVDLENTLEKHDILIKEWIKFKDDREKLRLYREKMTNSAIIVQAWWRGLLVRLQLGPYKVSKKKKKKEK